MSLFGWMRRKRIPFVGREAYGRWLRAHRPPFQWFCELDEASQEWLAQAGDEYATELAIAVGTAIADPEAAANGARAASGDVEAEEQLLQRLAERTAQRILGAQQPAPQAPQRTNGSPTMAGVGQRAKKAGTPPQRSFLGRPGVTE